MNPLWRMLMIVLLAVALPARGLPMASMQMHGAVGLPGLSTAHDVVQAEKGHPCHITGDGHAQSGSDCTDTAPCVSFCAVIGALSSPAMPLGAKGIHILVPAQEPVYISAVPVPLERPPRARSI